MTEIKERQEMAAVVGEMVEHSLNLSLKPMLDKAEQQKAEAEQVMNNPQASAQEKAHASVQLSQANATLNQYGQSSDIQMAIRAVTAVVQGIVTKDASMAVVGGLSPYANKLIKEQTGDNTAANLMAHAVLGAIEAQVTGNDAFAGAAAAVTGELIAEQITTRLYNKTPEQLTESEKQTVSTLSQVAGGLVGGAIGNNTASALSASETAKRAVENNYLAVLSPRVCLSFAWCRNKLLKETLIGGGSIALAGIATDQLLEKMSTEEAEHLVTLVMMGNGVVTQKYLETLTAKYTALSPQDIPKLEGYPIPEPTKPTILVYPEKENNPSENTLITSTYTPDKKDGVLAGGEIKVGDWRDNLIYQYHPKPELEEITGFPDLKPVKAKTPVQGGGKLRARWKDKDNRIFEWDSQHGELEMYDKRGKHLGAFDPKTGKQIKDADPKRRIEP